MARYPGAEAVYAAADLFRQRCLIEHKSLLWPTHDAWTVENIDALLQVIRNHQIQGTERFPGVLLAELAGQPDNVLRVLADATAFYYFFPKSSDPKPATRIAAIQEITASRPEALTVDEAEWAVLDNAYSVGIAHTTTHLISRKHEHIGFLLEFAQGIEQGRANITDPIGCRRLVAELEGQTSFRPHFRNQFLHLLFPDYFESIVSDSAKKQIVAAFTEREVPPSEIDGELVEVRRSIAEGTGDPEFDFSDQRIKEQWDPRATTDKPERYNVDLVRRRIERFYPDATARTVCLGVMAKSIELANSISPGSWSTSLGPKNIYLNVARPYVIYFKQDTLEIMVDLDGFDQSTWQVLTEDHLLKKTYDLPFKSVPNTPNAHTLDVPIRSIGEVLPIILPNHRDVIERLAKSVYTRLSPYKGYHPNVVEYLRQELGLNLPEPDYKLNAPPASPQTWLVQANPEIWNLAADLNKRALGDEDTWAVTRYFNEMKKGDRLLLWQSGPNAGLLALGEVTSEPFERPTSDFWPDKDARSNSERAISFRYTRILPKPLLRSELLTHPVLKEMQVIRSAQGTNFKVSDAAWDAIFGLLEQVTPPTIEDVADTAFMDVSEVRELEDLLLEKRQIVLEGPPGSGKTFIADLLARYLTGNPLTGSHNEQVQIVQFHQSYGYEDFIQGIRPRTDEHGQLRYEVVPGIFVQFCETARKNPDQRFVLVIDEINRGNISRIFGELMLLLEYRKKSVRLPYGDATSGTSEFSIPDNLYLIGTMNSTDRSLALIDYALRRRFYFYQLLPVRNDVASVLEQWLSSQDVAAEIKAHRLQLFTALNKRISEQMPVDFQIGHSYFMTADIGTDAGLDRVWRRAIMPLLHEYFHNSRDQHVLEQFQIDRLASPDLLHE